MSTALTFFIAMILNPDIQAKARAEIHSIVGPDRLPCISDRNSLPYVRSVITEVYRWNPAFPLGMIWLVKIHTHVIDSHIQVLLTLSVKRTYTMAFICLKAPT